MIEKTGQPDSQHKTTLRHYLPVFILLVVVVVPGVFAIMLYYSGWRPQAISVKGELINPPQKVNWQPLDRLNGAFAMPWSWQDSQVPQKKWSLVYLAPHDCDEVCVKNLYLLRAAHLGQGAKSLRVQRLAIATDSEAIQWWTKNDPGLIGLVAKMPLWQAMVAQLGSGFAIVDTEARLVLRYPPQIKLNHIKKELSKLLEYSAQG